MSNDSSNIQLSGDKVVISYASDPVIGRGKFRLENRGSEPVTASIESASLQLGADVQTLSAITAFDRNRECAIDPKEIEIGPMTTVEFYIGFPPVSWEPPFGETSSVIIRVRAGTVELQAASEVQFIRRTPRSS